MKKKRQDLGEGMNMPLRNVDCHKKVFFHTPLGIREDQLRTGRNGRG